MRTSSSKVPMKPGLFWTCQLANLAAAGVNAAFLVLAHTPISLIGIVNLVVMAWFFIMFTPRKER